MAALELLWPISGFQVGPSMLIEKLAAGVVQVQTPIGPRYVMPSFLQRVYLLWMFRNFPILPHAVLNRRQQRMIDRMCSEQRFASMAYADGMDEAPVIGTDRTSPADRSRSVAAAASHGEREWFGCGSPPAFINAC